MKHTHTYAQTHKDEIGPVQGGMAVDQTHTNKKKIVIRT